MKRLLWYSAIGVLVLGGCGFAVVQSGVGKDPQLNADQIIEIRTKQVAWLRAEPGCTLIKDAMDKVAAKYTPSGYVIQDSPDGLKLVKAAPEKSGKK